MCTQCTIWELIRKLKKKEKNHLSYHTNDTTIKIVLPGIVQFFPVPKNFSPVNLL